MGPFGGTVLHEGLLQSVLAARGVFLASALRYRSHKGTVEVVRESPTDLALNDWEAVLLQGLLSVLQFLELDEGEVKVLEQRSDSGFPT